jgi:hypothetical protein
VIRMITPVMVGKSQPLVRLHSDNMPRSFCRKIGEAVEVGAAAPKAVLYGLPTKGAHRTTSNAA